MNWSQVLLIFLRELRDQLRDRRTMFTICVLPMLLYPLMGLMMLQLAQVKTTQRLSIALLGESEWLKSNGALDDIRNESQRADNASIHWIRHAADSPLAAKIQQELPQAETSTKNVDPSASHAHTLWVEQCLAQSQSDAIVVIADRPPNELGSPESPHWSVLSNQRLERSRLAVSKLQGLIDRWHGNWLRQRLEAERIDRSLWSPPEITHLDIASTQDKQAVVWSKILPLIMLVWALTGAFYPAIDLCAGEKERGTLETLLSSPASRREIVWGKLLTIICFSVITALLNLSSMVITTSVVFKQAFGNGNIAGLSLVGPISFDIVGWLILLVVPMSAMFSALALAVASLAKSTKEGQYYLMPLLLVGFPLVILPSLPGMTLSSGTSIVPVTGAVLLARSLMDGDYLSAFAYFPAVACVTTLCCLLAIRWAVRQFENESVLFSEIEKGSLKHWLARFWQQRSDHPSATESVLCGLSILVALFFGRLAMGSRAMDWASFATSAAVIQIGLLLGPTLIMAVMLTRSIFRSIRLNRTRWVDAVACGLLALMLHPWYVQFAELVNREYPLGPETTEAMWQMDSVLSGASLASLLLIIAVLPALCEEVVFRGFVFSGLLENKGVLRAVVGSAVLFGLSHGMLQQTICATGMGLVMGWLAYRTGGIICTFVFHVTHNTLSVVLGTPSIRDWTIPVPMRWAIERVDGTLVYSDAWCQVSALLAMLLLVAISIDSRCLSGRVGKSQSIPSAG